MAMEALVDDEISDKDTMSIYNRDALSRPHIAWLVINQAWKVWVAKYAASGTVCFIKYGHLVQVRATRPPDRGHQRPGPGSDSDQWQRGGHPRLTRHLRAVQGLLASISGRVRMEGLSWPRNPRRQAIPSSPHHHRHHHRHRRNHASLHVLQ
ncbi:hypothetical protein F4821DRAFT_232054 [Hypoxylon rubiginosum]|uniref:Uncharacterized protein n=1 Tax=Hypoxylon rubiginosum TaxID=110542 RepID=A0ACC0D983_9PEZI|nr:hypothetical protein F4821DRAFT_232054 [Hypoxylon rubiginosum]